MYWRSRTIPRRWTTTQFKLNDHVVWADVEVDRCHVSFHHRPLFCKVGAFHHVDSVNPRVNLTGPLENRTTLMMF